MKATLFQFLMIIIILSACKKESTNQQSINIPSVSYIKNIIITDTTGMMIMQNTHYYDSLYRLVKISEQQYVNQDTLKVTYIFNYSITKVILIKTISADSLYHEKITYYLNSAGLAESSNIIDYVNPSDSILNGSDNYQYNSDGYLVSQTTTVPGGTPGTINFHYSNMNIDYLTGTPSSIDTKQLFYYDGSHFNSLNTVNAGIQFLGKSCYNPLTSVKNESPAILLSTYSYTYDSMNRISSLRTNGLFGLLSYSWVTIPVGTSHEIITYTYY